MKPFYKLQFHSISYLFGYNVFRLISLPLSIFLNAKKRLKTFDRAVRFELARQFKSICITLYSHENFIFSLVTIRSLPFVPRCKRPL